MTPNSAGDTASDGVGGGVGVGGRRIEVFGVGVGAYRGEFFGV
jgi:hypothetical protein